MEINTMDPKKSFKKYNKVQVFAKCNTKVLTVYEFRELSKAITSNTNQGYVCHKNYEKFHGMK